MVTVLDLVEPGIRKAAEGLAKTSAEEHDSALEQALPFLAKRIKSGTVTVQEIGSFLDSSPELSPELKEYLLFKKGELLFHQGHREEALRHYDQALSTRENPATWALKGTALLQMDRIDEAIQAFQSAYDLCAGFGPQKQEYLEDLFAAWGATLFFLGLDAVVEQNARELEKRVMEFLDVQEKAQGAGLEGIPGKVVFREPGGETPGTVSGEGERTLVIYAHETELKDAVEELLLAVKLLSIKDPFEGMRALSKEISKYWPEGLSAVDAVREQRDREWNT